METDQEEELKKVLSSVFGIKRSRALSRMDLKMAGSMEKRWFTPGDMERLVDLALSLGLLAINEVGDLQPTFDLGEVRPGINFKPSKRLLQVEKSKNEDLVKVMAVALAEQDGFDVKEAMCAMSKLKDEMRVHICMAGLTLCAEKDVKIDGMLTRVVDRVERDLGIKICS